MRLSEWRRFSRNVDETIFGRFSSIGSLTLKPSAVLHASAEKIKTGSVSGYDWLGFGLLIGLGFWMLCCAQIALSATIDRPLHPRWFWTAFAGLGFLIVLLAGAIYLRHTWPF